MELRPPGGCLQFHEPVKTPALRSSAATSRVLLMVALIVAVLAAIPLLTPSGQWTGERQLLVAIPAVSIFSLPMGECINSGADNHVRRVRCDRPHDEQPNQQLADRTAIRAMQTRRVGKGGLGVCMLARRSTRRAHACRTARARREARAFAHPT